MITYAIENTKFTVNADGTPDRITLVTWLASTTYQSLTATIGPRGTVIPGNYAPADVDFYTITEEELIDWIIALENQASIQAQLDAEINRQMHPPTGSGVPWQNAFPQWAVGVNYAIGAIVIFQNTGYECIQAHASQAQWSPPETPALWTFYVPESEGPQPWVQPLGAQDAYSLGAQVTHVGHLWTSLVSANVWEPPTQWQDEGVYP